MGIVRRSPSRQLLEFFEEQAHFHWVSDFAVVPDSRSYPEWAIVAERREWGRFYGEPLAFAVRHPRVPGEREVDLTNLLRLFENAIYQLDVEQQDALRPRLEEVADDPLDFQIRDGLGQRRLPARAIRGRA